MAEPDGPGDLCERAGEKGGGGVDGICDCERSEVEGSLDRSLDKFETDACDRGRRFASRACSSGFDIFSQSFLASAIRFSTVAVAFVAGLVSTQVRSILKILQSRKEGSRRKSRLQGAESCTMPYGEGCERKV